MRSRMVIGSFTVFALATSCVPSPGPVDEEPLPGRTTFAFEPIEAAEVTPRWGAPVAAGFLVGGVDDSMTVSDQVLSVTVVDGAMQATAVGTLDLPRFCGCALFDEGRRELIVLGGRDDFYRDATSAELLNVDTGERVDIDDGGAADHPVGCHGFFSPENDRGYVFGGAASSSGFTGDTWRWDPTARSFTHLEATGPAGRYDAGVLTLGDGGALLVGGMGGSAALKFYSDVWRFDAADESWSELVSSSPDGPPGRRVPWLALSPDESTLLYGFGSDSPQGQSVLGDLWRLDLPSGTWSAAELEGDLPEARGFTQKLPGPSGSAGVLAFGANAALDIHGDAFALAVPDDLAGQWR